MGFTYFECLLNSSIPLLNWSQTFCDANKKTVTRDNCCTYFTCWLYKRNEMVFRFEKREPKKKVPSKIESSRFKRLYHQLGGQAMKSEYILHVFRNTFYFSLVPRPKKYRHGLFSREYYIGYSHYINIKPCYCVIVQLFRYTFHMRGNNSVRVR